MKELRRDPITGDTAIYVSHRSKRPLDRMTKSEDELALSEFKDGCPFCRGNEHMCDTSMQSIEKDGEWIAKSVMNKFPILDNETDELFGSHEVIIDTWRHNGDFFNMSIEEFNSMLTLYRDRYREHTTREGIMYAVIFKNFQRAAGASLVHPHSQIVSFSLVPPEVEKELFVAEEFYKTHSANIYDCLIEEEVEHKERVIHESENFLVFVPNATRYNGEIRIFTKEPICAKDWTDEIIGELSYIFKELFANIYKKDGYLPFNLAVHPMPVAIDAREYYRFHIHIIPRRFNFGGFELSSNLFVCSNEPEAVAEALRF